jgi:ABC-type polysaccharide/polyol phosphate export permease
MFQVGFRLLFYYVALTVSTSIIDHRKSGIWNRVIVSGAKPYQLLFAHVLEGCIFVFIHLSTNVAFTIFFFVEKATFGSMMLLTEIVLLFGVFGIVFGCFVPFLSKEISVSTYLMQFVFLVGVFNSGVFWPIEAQPKLMIFFRSFDAIAHSIAAIRNIVFKGATVANHEVQMAFVTMITWILLVLGLILMLILKRIK